MGVSPLMADPAPPDANAMALVRTTVGSEDQAKALARRLVEKRLACCAHVHRIESFYEWDGKLQADGEWLVELRVPQALAEEAWVAVAQEHPYDTPLAELVPETRVNGKYAQWAQSVTGPKD